MKKIIYTFILSTCLCITATLTVNAQAGSLDNTFGQGGKVTTPIGSYSDYGWSTAIQGDGKIVEAGWSQNDADFDFALVRYNVDGTLDNTFGTSGKVTTPIGTYNDEGQSVTIQSDNKIVLAGFSFNGSNYDFALVRYNSDGGLDSTFGSGGIVTTDFRSGHDYGRSVVIQTDDKIVVTGDIYNGSDQDYGLVRYNSDGSLDTSFGSGGKVTTDFGGLGDYGQSVRLQPDGKIVVSGPSYNGSDNDFALVRYNSDGSLDNTFGSGGKVTTAIGSSNDQDGSVAIQGDGKIVAAGWSSIAGDAEDFAVARYNSDGSLDNTFGSGGKVITAIGNGDDIGESVALQSDGKIVLGDASYTGTDLEFALVRYKSDGSLDSTFSSGGKVTTDFGSLYDIGKCVTIQTDGKIVLVGRSGTLADYDFAIARYNGDPATTIENIAEENTIAVSPNPFSNELLIKGISHVTGQASEKAEIIIFDVVGKEILRQKTFGAETKVNTEGLLPGFYLLHYNDGNKTANIKLAKF